MQTPLAIIEGAYLRDILEQPAAMRRTTEAIMRSEEIARKVRQLIANDHVNRIVLTGMGSSYHALHPLYLRLCEAGHKVQMIETSEALYYLTKAFGPRTLTIAVSQSGESAEIVRLLNDRELAGPLIGITNTAESSLARKSTVAIVTAAGPEASVSCKTYLASLQALHFLGSALLEKDLNQTRKELNNASEEVESYLQLWQPKVDEISMALPGIEQIFITGRGPSLATAGTGGLILKESTRCSAEGMSSAAFRHGPLEMLSSRLLACICEGDERTAELNLRLFHEVGRSEASALLIGSQSPHRAFRISKVCQWLNPILEILPIQMLSLAIAATLGVEAGKFERASKITATE